MEKNINEKIRELYELVKKYSYEEGATHPCYDVFAVLCKENPKIKYNPKVVKVKQFDAIVFGLAEDYDNNDFKEALFLDFVNEVRKNHICIAYQGDRECMLNTDALQVLYKI